MRPLPRLALFSALFALVTALAGIGASDGLDTAATVFLFRLRTPGAADLVNAFTTLGDPLVGSVAAIGLALWLRRRQGMGGYSPLLLFVGVAIGLLLKQLIFQPPPPSEEAHDGVLLASLRHLVPYTYPSGHAFRVTFLGTVLGKRFPLVGGALYVLVALVALGRIYLAAEWVTDAIGGVLLALALSALGDVLRERVRR